MKTPILFASFFLFVVACATTPASPPKAVVSQPALAAGNSAAHKLGRSIVTEAGFEKLHQVQQLDFKFVVQDAGKTVFEAYHRWDLINGRARIAWTDKAGVKNEAWLDVATRKAVGTKDGTMVTGPDLENLSKNAYARYINDTYWLMMPLKLFDPGTTLQLEGKETVADTPYQVLRLSFAGVGLTPGDVYRLYVGEAGKRVQRWEMKLQGQGDKTSFVTWEDYREVGPLKLAHRHRIEGTDREVLLENVQVHGQFRDEVFAPPAPAPDGA